MAEQRRFGRDRVSVLAAAALTAATLAACSPTIEYTTTVPVAPGVTVSLTLASGYRGTVEFRCRQALPVTITGNETSIVLFDGGIGTTLDGGPYRYTAPGLTVQFEEGYQEVTITSVTGRRFCRGPASV